MTLTDKQFEVLIEWARGVAREWGRDMRARYEKKFGEPPVEDEVGGWDEPAWGEAWKAIREEDEENGKSGEGDIAALDDDDGDQLYAEAREAFDEAFFA